MNQKLMYPPYYLYSIIGVIFCILSIGCNNESTGFLPKEYNIYFLGNSITLHGPNEGIGWYGNWGMAATAEKNDYVHRVIDKVKSEYDNYFIINYGLRNITTWERDFTVKLDSLEYDKINLLIVRLGENVDEDYARNNNYQVALEGLIKKYKSHNTKIIITDNYWPSEYKDSIQKSIAIDNSYYFVKINDLYDISENSAFGQFEHFGVASHPSDMGMENIAERIFECIETNKIME
jgi:ribosome-interacting GTPase 1